MYQGRDSPKQDFGFRFEPEYSGHLNTIIFDRTRMFSINRIFCYVQNIWYSNNTEYLAEYQNFSVQQNLDWLSAAGVSSVRVLEPLNTVIFPSWIEHSGNEIKYRNILLVTETSQNGRMYFGRIFWSEVFGQNVDRNSIRWITVPRIVRSPFHIEHGLVC